jgi:hypothetical protein
MPHAKGRIFIIERELTFISMRAALAIQIISAIGLSALTQDIPSKD